MVGPTVIWILEAHAFLTFLCYMVGPTVIWILDSPAFLQFVFTLFPMDRDMSDCMCRRKYEPTTS